MHKEPSWITLIPIIIINLFKHFSKDIFVEDMFVGLGTNFWGLL